MFSRPQKFTHSGQIAPPSGGVASTIKSFPVASRGVVTGLVKTGNGISSGVRATQFRVSLSLHSSRNRRELLTESSH